jgi:hypothetical protein
MKAVSPTIQKIWSMFKFLKSGSNIKVKVTMSKIMVPIERSCHKEHTYEIPITYHSEDMANVKVFADRQTNGQAKNYMPPIFRHGDIKRH